MKRVLFLLLCSTCLAFQRSEPPAMPKDAVGNWEDCVGQILSVADSIKLTIQDIEAVLGGDTTKVHDLVTNISGFAKAMVGLPGACLKTDIANAGGCSDDLNQIGS